MWILQKIKFIYEDKVLATIMLVLFNILKSATIIQYTIKGRFMSR